MIEEWRKVEGWPYEVSNLGGVRRLGGKPLVTFPNTADGYPVVSLAQGPRRRQSLVHALMAEAFLGVRKAGMQVNHKDGCKVNNVLSNLEWVTHQENQRHALRLGLRSARPDGEPLKGRSSPQRRKRGRLTAEQAEQIRSAFVSGEKQDCLATRFGVSQSTISHCVRKRHLYY